MNTTSNDVEFKIKRQRKHEDTDMYLTTITKLSTKIVDKGKTGIYGMEAYIKIWQMQNGMQ